MAPRAHVLPALAPLRGVDGFFEFAQLWSGWKFGKGKPEARCVQEVLRLSAAQAVGVEAAPDLPDCQALPEAGAFLRATRVQAFQAAAVACGSQASGPILLRRGLRHLGAQALREELAADGSAQIPALKLLSYALSEESARGFARKRMRDVERGAQLRGLVYSLEVGLDDFVFVESPELCDQLPEEEVLVLHRAAVTLRPANVVDDSVPVSLF